MSGIDSKRSRRRVSRSKSPPPPPPKVRNAKKRKASVVEEAAVLDNIEEAIPSSSVLEDISEEGKEGGDADEADIEAEAERAFLNLVKTPSKSAAVGAVAAQDPGPEPAAAAVAIRSEIAPLAVTRVPASIDLNDTFRDNPCYFRNIDLSKYKLSALVHPETKRLVIEIASVGVVQKRVPTKIDVVSPVMKVEYAITHELGTGTLAMDPSKWDQLDRKAKDGTPIGPSRSKPFSHVYKAVCSLSPVQEKTTAYSPSNQAYDTEGKAYVEFFMRTAKKAVMDSVITPCLLQKQPVPVILEKAWNAYIQNRKKTLRDSPESEVVEECMLHIFEEVNPGFYVQLPSESADPAKFAEVCKKRDPSGDMWITKRKLELYEDAINLFPETIRIPWEAPVWTEVKDSMITKRGTGAAGATKFPAMSEYIEANPTLVEIYNGVYKLARGQRYAKNQFNLFYIRGPTKERVPEKMQELWPGDLVSVYSKMNLTFYKEKLKLNALGKYTNDTEFFLMMRGEGRQQRAMLELKVSENKELLDFLSKAAPPAPSAGQEDERDVDMLFQIPETPHNHESTALTVYRK